MLVNCSWVFWLLVGLVGWLLIVTVWLGLPVAIAILGVWAFGPIGAFAIFPAAIMGWALYGVVHFVRLSRDGGKGRCQICSAPKCQGECRVRYS